MSATVRADLVLMISKQDDMIQALREKKIFNAEQLRNVTIMVIHKALLSYIFLLVFGFLQGETLETITTATVCLFSAQPQLADQVPPLGHLHKIIQAMNHKNNAIPKSAIRVMHILSDNEVLNHLSAQGEKKA